MNFYPHFIGDYARDTAHLSLEQDAIYRRLLDHYYATERPLPADVEAIARIARCENDSHRGSVRYVLGSFFLQDSQTGAYHNARADREIERQNTRIMQAKANGSLGGKRKASKRLADATDSLERTASVGEPTGLAHQNHNQHTTTPTVAREMSGSVKTAVLHVDHQLVAQHHQLAFAEVLTRTRSPASLTWELTLLAEGGERPGAGMQKAFGWAVVGEALHALNIAGGSISPVALKGFCQRLVDATPEAQAGAGGAPAEVSVKTLHAKAMELLEAKGGAGR